MKFPFTVYRHIFPLVLFLPLICGCVEKDLVRNTFISFAHEADEAVSRASFINTSNDFTAFAVWGNYDGIPVFTEQEVVRVDNYWEYSPLQHWVVSADQYDFSAYSPVGVGTPKIINNRLSSIDVDCNAVQQDLVMAYTVVQNAEIGRPVQMTFRHPLSAVNFSIALNGNFAYTQVYKIISASWDKVYTEGAFVLNSNNTISVDHAGNAKETIPVTGFSGSTLSTSSRIESDYLFVIPQSRTDAVLRLLLDINGEIKEILKNVSITWEAGDRYTYNVTIDPFEISIETTHWEIVKTDDIIIQ